MFKVLVLVCSMQIAPQDCQIDSATDVIRGPVAANEIVCGVHGQAYLAATSLAPGPGSYVKIQCTRTAIAHPPVVQRAAEFRPEESDMPIDR